MPRRVLILGGGISGLACAWSLKKRWGSDIHITLLDKSHRGGGWIKTTEQNGFLFELGPHSCRPKGAGIETLKLIEELGLQDQVIVGNPMSSIRYLYQSQALQPLPHSFASFLLSPLMKGVPAALWHDLTSSRHQVEDETVFDFVSRRLSSEVAERLVDPFVSGIYAGDMHKLSARACFPSLHQRGSFVKGWWFSQNKKQPATSPWIERMQKSPLFSFKNGMETLTRAMFSRLDVEFRLGCKPTRIAFDQDKVSLEIAGGHVLEADHLISALPAYELAHLISSHDSEAASFMKSIPHATVGVVNLGYRRNLLKNRGFGYLIATREEEKILGCIWDSCVFPEQNRQGEETRLTVMLGGMRHPMIEVFSENDCLKLALEAVGRQLNIDALPDASHVTIARKAIPQFEVGYVKAKQLVQDRLNAKFPRLTLIGNGFHGVSLNDCISAGRCINLLQSP